MSGRPLRFFGAAALGWVAVRTVMLWPAAVPVAIPRALAPAAFADDSPKAAIAPTIASSDDPVLAKPAQSAARHFSPSIIAAPMERPPAPMAFAGPTEPIVPSVQPSPAAQTLLAPPPATPLPDRPTPSRWSASAWFLLRDGRGIAPGLSGGQLGGSQAGVRVAYTIDGARRLAIVGRVASPLKGPGREAALGVEWRPTKLPVRLVAEYRQSLDGGGSGPAAGVIGGTGPAPLALGFDLETYGQAGVIRRRRTEPFAEGAARLSLPVVKLTGVKVDLGLGAWGGAQRDAQRLDLGPSLGVRVPVANKSLRLSLDWRHRVAGNARPGSGPVLVIGSDF